MPLPSECSPTIHALHRDVSEAAAAAAWREAGATSPQSALSVFTAMYRRRWGCETALQGARLRLMRARVAMGATTHQPGAAVAGLDPRQHAAFARAEDRRHLGRGAY